MIVATDDLGAVVRAGGYQGSFVADVIVDGERVLADHPLSPCELTWDGDSKVRGTGRCVFQYTDELGRSIVPETITSWLTPYATVLNISYRVVAGDFSEKVLLGTFKIIRVTDPVDHRKAFQGRYVSVGSSVGLELADRFRVTDRERFPIPYGPSDLSSVWAEIGRLTGLPLLRSVDDAEIPRSVTYKENRLDAVFDLARILNGVPYVNSNGQVTIEPDVWPADSEEFASGSDGVIITRTPAALSDDGIYNEVVIRSYDDQQSTILARKQLESGPLRYGGTFGRVPYFASSQFVTTEEQAAAYAGELLPQVSSMPALQFDLEVLPDPRREVGDVVPFEWDGVEWAGRVREIRLGDSGPMRVRVVAENRGPVIPPFDLYLGDGVFPSADLYPSVGLYPTGGLL